MTTRAAIYVRVSVDRDGRSESPDRQLADCRKKAAERNLEVVEVYEERDRSAYSKKSRRPEYERLLADLKSGKVETVIVWKLDRLTRQGLRGLSQLLDLGAKLVSVTEDLDTTSAIGEGVVGILASVAKQESENTSRRVKRSTQAAAEVGKMHGGTRGYGYRNRKKVGYEQYVTQPDDLGPPGSIVEHEAEIIREAARRAIDGEPWNALARELNERGVTTATGGKWYSSTLRNVVCSPRVAGMRDHLDETHAGAWEPILTMEQHAKLVAVKGEPGVFRKPHHLLAGIAYCAVCGGKLKVIKGGYQGRYPSYQCVKIPGRVNRGCLGISQPSTEKFVRDEIFRRLVEADMQPGRAMPDVVDADALRKLIAEDVQAKEDLTLDRYVNRVLSHEMFLAAVSKIEARIERNEAELDRLEDEERRAEASRELRPGKLEDLLAWWERADVYERRAAVHGVVDRVEVRKATSRGRRFDTGRVKIHFSFRFLLEWGDASLAKLSPSEQEAAYEAYRALGDE